MCSVIEIKNANEYYIHYHSPESIPPNTVLAQADGKNNKKMEENSTNTINDKGGSAESEGQTKLKVAKKDQEVTSDRGSSASPSLEDEDEQQQNVEKVEIECPFLIFFFTRVTPETVQVFDLKKLYINEFLKFSLNLEQNYYYKY